MHDFAERINLDISSFNSRCDASSDGQDKSS